MLKTTVLKKVIVLGKYPINGRLIATAKIEIEINKTKDNFLTLSICGAVYNTAHKNYYYFCGQCQDELKKHFHGKKAQEIFSIWDRWHLNEMHAGCEHQRDFEKEPYEKHMNDICPICNHKYGADWRREELPADIIEKIKNW